MKQSYTGRIGISVTAVAILIRIVCKLKPHLFMALPYPLSTNLWISTGNPMPPYFSNDAWKEDEIDSWTKDDDLVVAVGAKSGTTFLLYCTHQIRTKGTDINDDLFPDVNMAAPFIDLIQSRGGSWAEQKDRLNTTVLEDGTLLKDVWDNSALPFRIFKSHYAPPELPVRREGGKKLKYLAMARNGLDVLASMTNFYSAHTDKFRNLWGGFPPDISGETHDGGNHPVAADMLPGAPLENIYFGYVKKWWPYRNDANVLLLHYSDVRKDLKGSVSKIAKFLGVSLSPFQLSKVTKRCSMDHMRTIPEKFRYSMPLNTNKGIWDVEKDYIVKFGKMVNKGEVGKGENKFSKEIVEEWRKAEEDQFGHDPALLKWARGGGKYPSK